MNNRPIEQSLELHVSNLGPIIQANIDLRPLTVFIGPSNTGKSYLAILIYALHRYFSGPRAFYPWPMEWRHKSIREDHPGNLGRVNIEELSDFVNLLPNLHESASSEEYVEIPGQLVSKIGLDMNSQGRSLGNEISRCFGITSTSSLIHKGTRNAARVGFIRRFSDLPGTFEHHLNIGSDENDVEVTMPESLSMSFSPGVVQRLQLLATSLTASDEREQDEIQFQAWELYRYITNLVQSYNVGVFNLPAFYLPADRTGVMHAHSVVVSSMIESAPMAGLRRSAGPPMLSGVLADFLQQLIGLEASPIQRTRTRREHDLGKEIEDAILGGSVGVDSSETINYPHFTYKPKGWKDALPLMNASSMVSELAPVVLYLRYLVEANHVLVVEEPESHLHPAMQVEFTRQIAALVRKGVRVIVTTHSEWVLEELANIVRRSELPDSQLNDGDIALAPSEVGAWLFKPQNHQKGSTVEEVNLDDETGLYPTDFDPVSEALYNESVDLFNRIQIKKYE